MFKEEKPKEKLTNAAFKEISAVVAPSADNDAAPSEHPKAERARNVKWRSGVDRDPGVYIA